MKPAAWPILCMIVLGTSSCVSYRQSYTLNPRDCAAIPRKCEQLGSSSPTDDPPQYRIKIPARADGTHNSPCRSSDEAADPKRTERKKDFRPSYRTFYGSYVEEEVTVDYSYDLGVLEVDDQGELWDVSQLTAIKGHLKSRQRDSLVVFFIHGWKNNASTFSECNKNLGSFKFLLENLAMAASLESNGRSSQDVIGIFIAWRGNNIYTVPSLWIGKQFGIYNRYAAAERVGRVGLSNALHRMLNWAKEDPERCTEEDGCKALSVVVGHSLGARVLEHVVFRSMTVETKDPLDLVPAHLVVLVNSASNAMLARQFVDAWKRGPATVGEQNGKRYRVPLIVSLTGPGDFATKVMMPPAMWLKSVFFTSFRRYDWKDRELGNKPNDSENSGEAPQKQRFYYTHAAGHTGKEGGPWGLWTHTINSTDECKQDEGSWRTLNSEQRKEVFFSLPQIRTFGCTETDDCFSTIKVNGLLDGCEYTITNIDWMAWTKCRDANCKNEDTSNPERCDRSDGHEAWVRGCSDKLKWNRRTPLWIMSVPRTMIPSHGRIFNGELTSLISGLVSLPGVSTEDGRPVQKTFEQEK